MSAMRSRKKLPISKLQTEIPCRQYSATGENRLRAVPPEIRSKFSYAAAALVLLFLRRASQAITPRPVAKSGSAPGSGVTVVGVMAVEKNAVPSSFPDQIH